MRCGKSLLQSWIVATGIACFALVLSGCGDDVEALQDNEVAASDDDSEALSEAAPLAMDCSCEGRVCGDDGCGVSCGTCDGADAFCFSGTCQSEATCPAVDISVLTQDAYRMDDKGKERLRYEATVEGSQFTKIEIISNRIIEEVGSLDPGEYKLAVESLTDCSEGVCIVGHMECNKQECAFPYIATLGTLELTSAGESVTQLIGSASELVFTQAYFDDKTRQYQILKKAESVCMPGFDIDVALEQIIIEPTDCTPEGTGNVVGTEIADFTMLNCEGEEVNLHDSCGYEAVWVVAVADW